MERDWIGILGNAKETYFSIPQTYNQGLTCQKLIDSLNKWCNISETYIPAGITQMAYQTTNQTQRASVNGSSFTDKLQEAKSANMSEVDAYTEHLRSKYGNVSTRSVGKDQASLERVGRGMSGSDVIIAPNILEQMATDPEKAAYYENKIDDYFNIFIPDQ